MHEYSRKLNITEQQLLKCRDLPRLQSLPNGLIFELAIFRTKSHLFWKENCDWLTELLPLTTEMPSVQAGHWAVENLVRKVQLLKKNKERDKEYEIVCQEWKIPSQTQRGPSQSSCTLVPTCGHI
jgi:hypothetical protein